MIKIYTDGSKTSQGVGAAYIAENTTRKFPLPKETSILSAELYALEMAVMEISNRAEGDYVIFSDSLSSLRMLQNSRNMHPSAMKILYKLSELRRQNKHVYFCWIPSHVGITGNERVDEAAQQAAQSPIHDTTDMVFYRDLIPVIQR